MIKGRKIAIVVLISLFLIFAFSIRFFYLVSANFLYLGTNKINTLLILLVYLLTYGSTIKIERSPLSWCILSFIPIILISSVVGAINYTQPIFNGIILQFYNYQYLLLYFPINELLKRKWLTTEDLFRLLSLFCCMLMIIALLQYLLVGNYTFMNCIISKRYGTTRLYIESAYINFWLCWVVDLFLQGKSKVKNAIFIVWGLFTIIAIIQSRAIVIAFLVLFISMALFKNKFSVRKIAVMTALLIAIWYLFTQTNIGINIWMVSNSSVNDLSLDVREEARQFYTNNYFQSPLWGQGYPDTGLNYSYIKSGQSLGYFYVDNGIYGIAFYYGTIGLLWTIVNLCIAIKDGVEIYKKNRLFFPIAYLLFLLSMSLTIQYDFLRPFGTYSLFLAILSDIKRNNHNNITSVHL